MSKTKTIWIVQSSTDELAGQAPVRWAVSRLGEALRLKGAEFRFSERVEDVSAEGLCILVAGAESAIALDRPHDHGKRGDLRVNEWLSFKTVGRQASRRRRRRLFAFDFVAVRLCSGDVQDGSKDVHYLAQPADPRPGFESRRIPDQ